MCIAGCLSLPTWSRLQYVDIIYHYLTLFFSPQFLFFYLFTMKHHLKSLQLKNIISQYAFFGFCSLKNKWNFLLVAHDHLFMTTVLQTMRSQENSIYIRIFSFQNKIYMEMNFERPFNCGLLSGCCRENYTLEQSNNCLYTSPVSMEWHAVHTANHINSQ